MWFLFMIKQTHVGPVLEDGQRPLSPGDKRRELYRD